jgi:hypothetical protein
LWLMTSTSFWRCCVKLWTIRCEGCWLTPQWSGKIWCSYIFKMIAINNACPGAPLRQNHQ